MNRLSRYGHICFAGLGPVSWCSKSVPAVTLSSCESELFAATETGCELIFVAKLQAEIFLLKPLTGETSIIAPRLLIDNKSALEVISKPGFHSLLRHVDIECKWIVQKSSQKQIAVEWIPGKLNAADIMTKPFARMRLNELKYMELN